MGLFWKAPSTAAGAIPLRPFCKQKAAMEALSRKHAFGHSTRSSLFWNPNHVHDRLPGTYDSRILVVEVGVFGVDRPRYGSHVANIEDVTVFGMHDTALVI